MAGRGANLCHFPPSFLTRKPKLSIGLLPGAHCYYTTICNLGSTFSEPCTSSMQDYVVIVNVGIAINSDCIISIKIKPTRLSALAGRTCRSVFRNWLIPKTFAEGALFIAMNYGTLV
jgi:hypothetical protein